MTQFYDILVDEDWYAYVPPDETHPGFFKKEKPKMPLPVAPVYLDPPLTNDPNELVRTHRMRIYIAGPMRGYPKFNFPAFYDAQRWLDAHGFETFNPAQSDKEKYGPDFGEDNHTGNDDPAVQTGFSLREALGRDTAWIAGHADALYMLTGWEKSTGAKAEWTLGVALGLQIFYQGGIEDFLYKDEETH